MLPRLISLEDAIRFLGGKHPSRFKAEPVCKGRDSVWDLVELNALLNRRLADRGVLPPDTPPPGAANDYGQDELEDAWKRINAAPAGGVQAP